MPWTKRFIAAAIIQGAIIVALTAFLVLSQISLLKPEISRAIAAGGAFNISRIATVGNEIQNDKNNINIELIPSDILEMVENLGSYNDTRKPPTTCFGSKPDYYYCYSLISAYTSERLS